MMDSFSLPYCIQTKVAKVGHTTLQDLAERWDTPETAREKVNTAFKFEDTQP